MTEQVIREIAGERGDVEIILTWRWDEGKMLNEYDLSVRSDDGVETTIKRTEEAGLTKFIEYLKTVWGETVLAKIEEVTSW